MLSVQQQDALHNVHPNLLLIDAVKQAVGNCTDHHRMSSIKSKSSARQLKILHQIKILYQMESNIHQIQKKTNHKSNKNFASFSQIPHPRLWFRNEIFQLFVTKSSNVFILSITIGITQEDQSYQNKIVENAFTLETEARFDWRKLIFCSKFSTFMTFDESGCSCGRGGWFLEILES